MKRFLAILLSALVLFSSVTAFGAESKLGFDVSYYNTDVDFAVEAENGKSFVMIRIGNFTYLDKEFWSNVQKAVDARLPFGVYMYSAAFDVDEAKLEADFVIKTLKEMTVEQRKYFTLPVALDMEASGLKDFSKAQLTNQVVAFSNKIIKAGYVPMVYANVDWYTNKLDIKKFKDNGYKIWLSHWSTNPDLKSKKQVGATGVYADMWQYQGGSAKDKVLDQNVVYDINSLKHIYDNGVVSKKPTSAKAGTLTKTCRACGRQYNTSITKLSKASISKLSPSSKAFTVYWKKAKNVNGYQIKYSTTSSFKKSVTKTVSKSTAASLKISKLSAKKKYYVRIRTYRTINGTKYYSDWSGYKTVTTKK